MNTIFVQIASYRDPQLIPTLDSLLDNASHPENLRIGICWQHGPEEGLELFLDAGFDLTGFTSTPEIAKWTGEHPIINASYKGATLTIIDVPHLESQGACWARWSIQQLYDSEKYTLQLDSHHRFVEGWDTLCINMLEGLRKKSAKPLLTAYIPSFDPENDPAGRVQQPWKMDFDRFIPEGAVFFIPSTIEDAASRTEPMRARFYSAHFAFADGSFAVEVQHDPEYFFHGEEISIAARAFTHGYDLYHPHVLVAWHEYTRKNRVKVWDDHTPEARSKDTTLKKDWLQRNNECHLRNRILFGMDGLDPKRIDFGKYGFGSVRTLAEYEAYAGISFEYRGVQQFTLDKNEPVYPVEKTWTPEEWKNSFVGSHDLHICVHRNDLGEVVDDYDFCYVGAHDENGEVFRKDLSGAELRQYVTSRDGWINYRFIFLSDRTPTHYTVWPHSASKGWMSKIDRTV